MTRALILPLMLVSVATAQTEATTQPTEHRFVPTMTAQTRPSTQPTDIRALLTQLNDRQAAVRDAAEEQLMSLPFNDLPQLQAVVTDARPIFPNQAALLREVVAQIVLAHETYAADPANTAFLGLSFPPLADFNPADEQNVRVMVRYPGFSSYQMLRDGDVITNLLDHPDWPMSRASFPENIHKLKPGDTIRMVVDRHGKTMVVPCVLRAWPANCARSDELENWLQPRQALADQYWQDHFAGLMSNDAS